MLGPALPRPWTAALLGLLSLGMRCPPASSAAAAADDGRTPIAVLHFVDRSAQDEWGWLGKGLADMLITDLSVSGAVVIVDRDRMAAAVAETGLAESGLADVTNAGKAGQVCKVAQVVFGSFVHQRGRLVIEAHVADVDSGKLLQVQHVEGSPDELFQLEKQLARQLLEGLHAPLSAADLAKLERLPTRSLPAVEHYSRSLSHFDRGDWHAALLACRLAQRSDPGFLKAAIRVAKLYREVGEPEHALVEYRRLTDADADNSLPEIVYLELGRLLEDSRADEAGAAAYHRILARYPTDPTTFDVRNPGVCCRPRSDLDDGQTINWARYRANQAEIYANETRLRAIERLALIDERLGRDHEAAVRYSEVIRFFWIHYLAQPGDTLTLQDFHERVAANYARLYWRYVRADRDAALRPPESVCLIPPDGATLPGHHSPTHGDVFRDGHVYLASPGFEIARLVLSLDTHRLEATGGQGDKRTVSLWWRQAWKTPGQGLDGYQAFPVQTGIHKLEVAMKPGGRAVRVDLPKPLAERGDGAAACTVRIELRPASGQPQSADPGQLRFELFPPVACVTLDGQKEDRCRSGLGGFFQIAPGEHVLDVLWSDGRRQTRNAYLEPGGQVSERFHADAAVGRTRGVGDRGVNGCLLSDLRGMCWLVWDSGDRLRWGKRPDRETDLYYAASPDGESWTAPLRLAISSEVMDTQPILQQAPNGTYWLMWISARQSEDPSAAPLWIASSPDGRQWSFPRKVPVRRRPEPGVAAEIWLEQFAFAIDQAGAFWCGYQDALYRSADGVDWQAVESLAGKSRSGSTNRSGQYQLHGVEDGLVLVAQHFGGGATLWRRERSGAWQRLGEAGDVGGLVGVGGGRIVCSERTERGIFLNSWEPRRGWMAPVPIAYHIQDPRQPVIAASGAGRCVVACSTDEGLTVTTVRMTFAEPRPPLMPSLETQPLGDPSRLCLTIDVSAGPSADRYPVAYSAAVPDASDDRFKTHQIVLRRIPAGTFTMGSPDEERSGWEREFEDELRHQVTLREEFYVGVFEVTQRQWESVMGHNPAKCKGETRPVETVNWDDVRGGRWPGGEPAADSLLGRLRRKSGLNLDLPTEAQWEYACRAGTLAALNDGQPLTDENVRRLARYYKNGGYLGNHAVVGSYAPNAWGLFDMHGNVAEWCLDWYGPYCGQSSGAETAATDPVGQADDRFPFRVRRGGGAGMDAMALRSAARWWTKPDSRSNAIGFRLVALPRPPASRQLEETGQ